MRVRDPKQSDNKPMKHHRLVTVVGYVGAAVTGIAMATLVLQVM